MKQFLFAPIATAALYCITSHSAYAQGLEELIPREESEEVATPTVTPTPTPTITTTTIQDPRAKARAELLKLPKSGVLSTTETGSPRGTTAQGWGETKEKTIPAPIVGSVNDSGKGLVAQVTNNSQEIISLSAKVTQKTAKGKLLKTDYFTATLAPKKSASRTFSKRNGATGNTLEMVSWKVIGK